MRIWLGLTLLGMDKGWRIIDQDSDAFVEVTFPGDGTPRLKAKLYSSSGEPVIDGEWLPDASGRLEVEEEDAYLRMVPAPAGRSQPGDLALEISSFNTAGERSMDVAFGIIRAPRGLEIRVLNKDGSL